MITNLKELRTEKGWSQMRLAAEVGIHINSLIGYESGRVTPSLSVARKIADCLGVPVEAVWPEEP